MNRALQVDHKDHLLALGHIGYMVKDLGFQGLGLRVYGAKYLGCIGVSCLPSVENGKPRGQANGR